MNKYKVILLLGEAGSGKDYIAKLLMKYNIFFKHKLHKVITATTRPPRQGEIDGINYYFMNKDIFKNIEMLESTCFNSWYYGTPIDSLSKEHINLAIVNSDGLESYLSHPEVEIIDVIYLRALPQ